MTVDEPLQFHGVYEYTHLASYIEEVIVTSCIRSVPQAAPAIPALPKSSYLDLFTQFLLALECTSVEGVEVGFEIWCGS